MGLMSGVRGNACAADVEEARAAFARLLGPGEQLQHAFKVVRDMLLFTDRRLILVDKQGMTGKKVEYLSLPYGSIVRFAVETAGTFDLDAELKVWTSGMDEPIEKRFSKAVDIYEVQGLLAAYVAGE